MYIIISIIQCARRYAPRGTSDWIFLNICIFFLSKRENTEIQELFSRTIPKTFLNNYGNRNTSICFCCIVGSLFPKHIHFVLFKKGEYRNTRTILPKQIKQNGKWVGYWYINTCLLVVFPKSRRGAERRAYYYYCLE